MKTTFHPTADNSIVMPYRRLHLPHILYSVFCILYLPVFLASCSSDTEDYDPYHDWRARNEAWFSQIADSARRGGSQWLSFKSALKSPQYQSGQRSDSIFVHVLTRGEGTVAPAFTDTVRINFRGTLMPTQDVAGTPMTMVFTQTYYQGFDPATAAPQKSCVASFTAGFATALQHMVEGDDWLVYIPSDLFYGGSAQGTIPAYSAACFRINMVGVYPLGTTVPDWK